MSDLLYHLNARDEIAYVNEEWLSFARANQGEPLRSPQILGRLLWDFIADVDTQHVYRLLHGRVRTTGAPVRLRFRCDGPTVRRRLELEISPRVERGLSYQVRTLSEQVRDPVPLLDPQRLRSERFVTVCSWCKRVGGPAGAWLEVEQAVEELALFAAARPPQITHGICGACARILDATLSGAAVNGIMG